MKTLILVILLVIALARGHSVKHIKTCSKREVELRVWKKSCLIVSGKLRYAHGEYKKYNEIYVRASRAYDYAVGAFKAAEKEEHKRKSIFHAAEHIYRFARKAEDKLCNRLVRNVKPGTPCAKLLNRARRNNRLVRCKLAKRALAVAIRNLKKAKYNHVQATRILKQKYAEKVARYRARDAANMKRLEKLAIFKTLLRKKIAICSHYRSLKLHFFGRKKYYRRGKKYLRPSTKYVRSSTPQ